MREFKLGSYFLELGNVDIFVAPELCGGSFAAYPGEAQAPKIVVGFYLDEGGPANWGAVIGVLLHEVMEYLMHSRRCRLSTSGDQGHDHSEYTFLMDHPTYSHICQTTGQFLCEVLPDLALAYDDVKHEWEEGRKE